MKKAPEDPARSTEAPSRLNREEIEPVLIDFADWVREVGGKEAVEVFWTLQVAGMQERELRYKRVEELSDQVRRELTNTHERLHAATRWLAARRPADANPRARKEQDEVLRAFAARFGADRLLRIIWAYRVAEQLHADSAFFASVEEQLAPLSDKHIRETRELLRDALVQMEGKTPGSARKRSLSKRSDRTKPAKAGRDEPGAGPA